MTDAAGAGGRDVLVDETTINRVTDMMDGVLNQLNGTRSSIATSASDTAAGWHGDAAGQFASGAQDADATIHRLISSLQNLRELVQMSKNQFTAEEQEQASRMRAVGSQYSDISLNGGIADA
ncbi:WXG100 family type VII secretion target [Streptomyces avicenniae]|uniref:WXG100 family type VII secretion target n=1 Tax=Streptomyces avicenniae TaxID=500153 RepID=UPI00069C8DFE|nr:hypothetical protein [Streptomyces avicenniae]